MSADETASAAALQGLLDHIGRERELECAWIAEQVEIEARQLLREARRAARLQVAAALAAQRAEVAEKCIAARASADTQLRRQRQRLARRALDEAWPLLHEALLTRWRDASLRARWAGAALDLARRRLVDRRWIVTHPPDWTTAERTTALAALGPAAAELSVQWRADAALSAGLRIEAGDARLDAAPSGLLVQRARVEARLLALLELPPGAEA